MTVNSQGATPPPQPTWEKAEVSAKPLENESVKSTKLEITSHRKATAESVKSAHPETIILESGARNASSLQDSQPLQQGRAEVLTLDDDELVPLPSQTKQWNDLDPDAPPLPSQFKAQNNEDKIPPRPQRTPPQRPLPELPSQRPQNRLNLQEAAARLPPPPQFSRAGEVVVLPKSTSAPQAHSPFPPAGTKLPPPLDRKLSLPTMKTVADGGSAVPERKLINFKNLPPPPPAPKEERAATAPSATQGKAPDTKFEEGQKKFNAAIKSGVQAGEVAVARLANSPDPTVAKMASAVKADIGILKELGNAKDADSAKAARQKLQDSNGKGSLDGLIKSTKESISSARTSLKEAQDKGITTNNELRELRKLPENEKAFDKWAKASQFGRSYPTGYQKTSLETKFENLFLSLSISDVLIEDAEHALEGLERNLEDLESLSTARNVEPEHLSTLQERLFQKGFGELISSQGKHLEGVKAFLDNPFITENKSRLTPKDEKLLRDYAALYENASVLSEKINSQLNRIKNADPVNIPALLQELFFGQDHLFSRYNEAVNQMTGLITDVNTILGKLKSDANKAKESEKNPTKKAALQQNYDNLAEALKGLILHTQRPTRLKDLVQVLEKNATVNKNGLSELQNTMSVVLSATWKSERPAKLNLSEMPTTETAPAAERKRTRSNSLEQTLGSAKETLSEVGRKIRKLTQFTINRNP